jgi:Cell wall-active antibiotics response LiaF, C-terminal
LWPDGDWWWLFLLAGGLILWFTRNPGAGPTTDAKELAAADSRRVRRVVRGFAIFVASLLTLVLLAVAIFMVVFDVHVGRGIGERDYVVTNAQELRDEYRLGIGSLEVDLSRVQLPPGETRLETSVDVGDLEVIVPADVALRVHADAQAGRVEVLGNVDDGRNADVDVSEVGNRVLVLDADVGAGALWVRRAVR